MEIKSLETMFARMGARVVLRNTLHERERAGIDVRSDKHGEYFDIRVRPGNEVEYEVVDIQPRSKHLLLMERHEHSKVRFLCGHDERHWFVCAVPGDSVSNVAKAMEALQPDEVRQVVRLHVKRIKNRLRRRNKAFVRQGEWFFIPAPELVVNPKLVLKNEPISRGRGSKPHMCQFLYRTGGVLVHVCRQHPSGITTAEYTTLLQLNEKARHWDWTRMMRDPKAYVSGRVWHPDHKTIVLDGWHRVLMNTEHRAPGASSVVFLD